MKFKKRCISALVTASMMLGIFSPFGGLVQKVESASVNETLFPDSVVKSLKLQPKNFEHNGSTNKDATLAMNFTEEEAVHIESSRYSGYGQYLGSGSYYPKGHNYYRSSDFEVADEWHINFEWKPDNSQMDILDVLITSANTLQISGRYDGYYDTQAGKNAGQVWMSVAQANSSRQIASTEKKISTSVSKATFHAQALSWVTLADDSSFTHFDLDLGATKGASGAFVDDKNHARLANPEFYIRDTTSPFVQSITIADNNKNYAYNDKITVNVKFSEPVRVSGDYSSAFTLKNDILGTFTPVSYSDYTQTLTYEMTVPDQSNAQISAGNFSLKFSWKYADVTDLAGNTMDSSMSEKTAKDGSVIVSGYEPRISSVKYVSAEISDGSSYTETNSLQGSIKPGDRLYFDIYFNQEVTAFDNEIYTILMNIGNKSQYAVLDSIYLNSSVLFSASGLYTFNRLRYCLEIPTGSSDGSVIELEAAENGGFWELADNSDWLSRIKGNLILTDTNRRHTINPVTQIVSSGNYILSEMKIDRSAPVLSLTDGNGNPAPVYDSAIDAADAEVLQNSYELYVKSNEEVLGSVSAVLKYKLKNSEEVISGDTMTTGAYTTDPVRDMCFKFSIPANIDSAAYDIWLEVTASDMIYNKDMTYFYLAADTLAPTVVIESSEMVDVDGESKAWQYEFNVSDNASVNDMKLFYRFNGESELFSDSGTDFIVLSDNYTKDAIVGGAIEYYAVDGMGNKSTTGTDSFIMGDIGSICTPVPTIEDIGNKYNPPRSVEFEGFREPQTADGETHYYYLVYQIGLSGEYRAIKSESGENVSIPESELQHDCTIHYWMISSPEDSLADKLTEDALAIYHKGQLLYRCDNEAPELEVVLEENHVGNNEFLTITAPAGDHPANITKMEIALFDTSNLPVGEKDVTSMFVHDGAVVASMSLENILTAYSLPSGEYSMEITLTDANGHSASYEVLTDEPIIKEKPVITDMEILTKNGDVVSAVDEDGAVVIDSEELYKVAEAGAFEDGFELRTDVFIRYEGSEFPNCDFEYSISTDSGETWTFYSESEITVEKNGTESIDDENYIYFRVRFPLPEQEIDGESSILVRVNCNRNPYISEPVRISTLNDLIEPVIAVTETEAGNDEKWHEVDYTNDYVKLAIDKADIGIFTDVVGIAVTDVEDRYGNPVDRADFSDYIELYENEDGATEAVVKENCTVIFTAEDAWGNTASVDYTCGWIDDLTTGVHIYDTTDSEVDTELYTYFTVRNYKEFVLAAVEPGVTEITDADIARFKELSYIDSGESDDDDEDDDDEEENEAMRMSYALVNGTATTEIVEVDSLATMTAARNGDLNSVMRIYQRQLSAEPYDIVCGVTDRRGNITVYPIMSVLSETEEIVAEEFTSSVTNLGNVIEAVQVLSFNKPVAQLDDDLVEEIIQDGYTPDRNDITFRDLAFATTISAVIEDDNVRSDTVAEVYVTDVYGQIFMVEVDITGTTFVEYEGYTINYYDNGELVDDDHIFGENSEITLEISGNDGVSMILPTSLDMNIKVEGEGIAVGGENYYYKVSMTMGMDDISGEGYYHAADLSIINTTSGEKFTEEIVFQYDTKPPVLVDAIEMLRNDPTDSGKVVYIFYDRRYVDTVYEIIEGEYVEQHSINGICYAEYIKNTEPVVAALDCDGNMSNGEKGPGIDDVISTNTLKEGVDFVLYATDVDGNALTDGEYYRTVFAEIRKLGGGKNFTVEPSGTVEVTSERPIIFKLIDEAGGSMLYQYTPPVDRTPPTVTAVQNNSGGIVSQIIYTITATDARAGVESVYIPLVGDDGTTFNMELEPEEDNPNKYIFAVRNSQDFTVIVTDKLGNQTEHLLTSNSAIVGALQVDAVYNPSTGYTNTGTRVTISATDKRRIYLAVDTESADTTLSASDYLISGTNIYITKNGTAKVICTDEIGNIADVLVVVTNVDKTAPTIKATVSEAYTDGAEDPSRMRITFAAASKEDLTADGTTIPNNVFLLRKTDEELTFENNTLWDEYNGDIFELWAAYQKEPEAFKYNEDFLEIAGALYKHDISLITTYVDVTTNGTHLFYFVDKAGNTTTHTVEVTGIDDVAPTVSSVAYSYDYRTGDTYETLTPVNGTVSLNTEKNLYLIDTTDVRPVTNQSVTVTITVNEPVVLYGSGNDIYSETVKMVFTDNGTYAFNLMDEAGNIAQAVVEVANILKREIYIELESTDTLVLFEGNTTGYDPNSLKSFSVYTYSGDIKVGITASKTAISCDDSLDLDNINANTFSRSNPYVIKYTAWDEAGNKAELTKQIILCAKDDIVVMVDGVLPDAAGVVYAESTSAEAVVENYHGLTASVRFAKGQFNGAQMKTRGTVLTAVDGKYALDFSEGEGWYTLYVRTLYQDLYVVRIYAGVRQ